MPTLNLGDQILLRRRKLGLTIQTAAKTAGISRNYWAAIERNRFRGLTLGKLIAIIHALGMDLEIELKEKPNGNAH